MTWPKFSLASSSSRSFANSWALLSHILQDPSIPHQRTPAKTWKMVPLAFSTLCLSFRGILHRESTEWPGSLQIVQQDIDLIKQHLESLQHSLEASDNIIQDTMSRDLIKQHFESLQRSLEAIINIIRDTTSRDFIFKEGNDQDKDSVAGLEEDVCAALDKTRRLFEGLQRWFAQESSFKMPHNCEFNSNQDCVMCSDLRKMENEIRTARVAWMK